MGAGLTSSLVEERRGEERRHADGHADICPYMETYAHSLVEERRGGDMLMDMLIYAHIWRC